MGRPAWDGKGGPPAYARAVARARELIDAGTAVTAAALAREAGCSAGTAAKALVLVARGWEPPGAPRPS